MVIVGVVMNYLVSWESCSDMEGNRVLNVSSSPSGVTWIFL